VHFLVFSVLYNDAVNFQDRIASVMYDLILRIGEVIMTRGN
jgi:hypothetical protein